MVEISALKETRKVKSIQMFRKPVNKAKQGDRIGLCVTQFEASQLERGLVATPGYLPTVFGAIISIKRISYYKGICSYIWNKRIGFTSPFITETLFLNVFFVGDISSKSKFHISIGHETVMANLTLFGCSDSSDNKAEKITDSKVLERCIDDMNELTLEFDFKKEYKVVPSISCDKAEEDAKQGSDKASFALLEFERPVVLVPSSKGK